MISILLLLQIYTDWANHYLEKARSKKRVNSLATDCSDGVLLAEVIESVSEFFFYDIVIGLYILPKIFCHQVDGLPNIVHLLFHQIIQI